MDRLEKSAKYTVDITNQQGTPISKTRCAEKHDRFAKDSNCQHREGSGTSSGTSGISSECVSEASSDAGSTTHSHQNVPTLDDNMLLTLSERGEWLQLDQRLRNIVKGSRIVNVPNLEVITI